MILNIIFTITGFFFFLFLESFFLAFFNFRLVVVLFFLLVGKVDWRLLCIIFVIIFLVLDVVTNVPLGTNLLVVSILFLLYTVASLFFSVENGVTGFLVHLVLFSLYYVSLEMFVPLLVVGHLGYVKLDLLGIALLKGFLNSLLLLLLEYFMSWFRNRGSASQICLK